jgi:hypothetical protein
MKLTDRSRDVILQAIVNERGRWEQYHDSLPANDTEERKRAAEMILEIVVAGREFRE